MKVVHALIRVVACTVVLVEGAYSHHVRPADFQFGGGL